MRTRRGIIGTAYASPAQRPVRIIPPEPRNYTGRLPLIEVRAALVSCPAEMPDITCPHCGTGMAHNTYGGLHYRCPGCRYRFGVTRYSAEAGRGEGLTPCWEGAPFALSAREVRARMAVLRAWRRRRNELTDNAA